MKKTKIFLPLIAVGLAMGMGLTACDKPATSGGKQSTQVGSSEAQPKIKVTAAGDKKTLVIGETVALSADVQGVAWTSTDNKVATVDNDGKVTAVAAGEATIKATKEGYKDGAIAITVNRPAATATFDLTTAADHYSADGWWELGGGMFAMQTINGWNPIAQTSTWGQETEEPAETFIGGFDVGDKETVKFTASKAEKAELVLNIGNSDEVTLSEIMTVKLNGTAISLANISLEAHSGQYGNSLEFGEVSLGKLDLAANNTLEFEFLKSTNVFLDEVAVYAKEATIALTAPAAKQQIAVTSDKLSVIVDETVNIQTQVQGVSYTSVDETIATVNQNGVVTGVKVGKTYITVKKEGMYSVRVEITVNPKPVAGQIIVEAESAEELADLTPGSFNMSGPSIMQDGGMMGGSEVHSGGAYVMAFGGDGLTLTMKFQATQSAPMILSIVGSAPMSMGGDAAAFVFADSMTVKLNNNQYFPNTGAEFPAPEGYTSTMTEVVFGNVVTANGENTLVVEITGSVPSLDCFKFSVM